MALRLVLISFFFVLAGSSFDGNPTGGYLASAIGSAGFALGLMRLCGRRHRERRKENLAAVLLGLPLVAAAGYFLVLEMAQLF